MAYDQWVDGCSGALVDGCSGMCFVCESLVGSVGGGGGRGVLAWVRL
jgi:hypothetical protein